MTNLSLQPKLQYYSIISPLKYYHLLGKVNGTVKDCINVFKTKLNTCLFSKYYTYTM